MTEPTTEAGKQWLANPDWWLVDGEREHAGEVIAAIEAEARIDGRAQGVDYERARIREAVRELEDDCHSHSGLRCDRDDRGRCTSINRDDVARLAQPEDDHE